MKRLTVDLGLVLPVVDAWVATAAFLAAQMGG
jgi:hypothetical protein